MKRRTLEVRTQCGKVELHALDCKGDALTFKATTARILATLQYCIELMGHTEELLKKKLEREQIAMRWAEQKCRQLETVRGGERGL